MATSSRTICMLALLLACPVVDANKTVADATATELLARVAELQLMLRKARAQIRRTEQALAHCRRTSCELRCSSLFSLSPSRRSAGLTSHVRGSGDLFGDHEGPLLSVIPNGTSNILDVATLGYALEMSPGRRLASRSLSREQSNENTSATTIESNQPVRKIRYDSSSRWVDRKQNKENTSANEDKQNQSSWRIRNDRRHAHMNSKLEGTGRQTRRSIRIFEYDISSEQFSELDNAIAWVLLGVVVFSMSLFYLVNWPDDQIRRYAWCTISTTISIFLAVLTFTGIKHFIIHALQTCGLPERFEVFVAYGFFLAWFVLLELALLVGSGVICDPEKDIEEEMWTIAEHMWADSGKEIHDDKVVESRGRKSIAMIGGAYVFVQRKAPKLHLRESGLKAWGTLCAHTAGFAAIYAGGKFQHMSSFATRPHLSFIPIVINQLLLTILFRVSSFVRSCIIVDPGETRSTLCMEEAEEAENEISSLSTSYLFVNAVRFFLTGVLPNEEGIELPEKPHDVQCIALLYLIGVLSALNTLLVMPNVANCNPSYQRLLEIAQNTCSMTFAWCTFWATRSVTIWANVHHLILPNPDTMEGRIYLALQLSMSALACVFLMDWIEDQGAGPRMHRFLQNFINALSILVGFSWEHCFAGAVAAAASETSFPAEGDILLTIAVAIVIIPAWRRHILATVLNLRRVHWERILGAVTSATHHDITGDDLSHRKSHGFWQGYKPVTQEDIDCHRDGLNPAFIVDDEGVLVR